MKILPLITLAAVAGVASAKYFVIKTPTFNTVAASACKNKGGRLANIRTGRHHDVRRATKALRKAKVSSAWIRSVDHNRGKGRAFLKEPKDRSDKEGEFFVAECHGGECNTPRAVLCKDDDEYPKKRRHGHKGKRGMTRKYRHGRKCAKGDSDCDEESFSEGSCEGGDCESSVEESSVGYDNGYFGDIREEPRVVSRKAPRKPKQSYY